MRNWSPQSQRREASRSPVKQEECTPHQGRGRGLRVSQHDGDRLLVLVADAVGDDPARSIARGQIGLGNAIDQLLALAAILDQLLDGDDLQVVPPRQIDTARRASAPLPAVRQHFAKHSRRLEPGHAGQVDRRLRMPCSAKHSAFFGD